MKRIVAGTTNPAKVAALRALLAPDVEVVEAPFRNPPVIDEVGETITEIASNKARDWAAWLTANGLRLPVIVTDGGLTVPALAGWNPARTRRFAGEHLTPLQLALALLDRASALKGEQRRIGWTEAAAIVRPDGQTRVFAADSPPGMLATAVRPGDLPASDGFWVPAIWLCPELDMKRLIDLNAEERSSRSDHWDRLGEALRQDLATVLSD